MIRFDFDKFKELLISIRESNSIYQEQSTLTYVDKVDSTMNLARSIYQEDSNLREKIDNLFTFDSLVLANEQLSGRGRNGKKWISKLDSSLTFTVNIKDKYVKHGQLLPAAVALAISTTLKKYKIHSKIKWPNDILILTDRWRKLSGILIEKTSINSEAVYLIGIGINLNQFELPIESEIMPISLNELGFINSAELFLIELLQNMSELFLISKEELLIKYSEFLLKDCQVKVISNNNAQFGKIIGINDDFSVNLLSSNNEIINFSSAHIEILDANSF